MSFSLVSQPVNFAAAYKPVLWSFTSSFSPVNTNAGESNIPILEIRLATAADIAAYNVNPTDVLMSFAPTPDVLFAYQQFSITGTDDGLYSGTFRVRYPINSGLVVIDATWVGDDTGGAWTKVYERYTMIAEVAFSGLPSVVRYEMKALPDGTFSIDIRDAAQRGFRDILSHPDCRPGLPYIGLAEAQNYITQTYSVKIYHGYVLTSASGEFSFVEISKGVEVVYPKQVVVNAVQPDNHVDIDGAVDLSWQDDLRDYVMNNTTTGSFVKRFLTYAPMDGQVMGLDDDAFLAFLWSGMQFTPIDLLIRIDDDAGNQLSLTEVPLQAPLNSGVIRIGPRNLGALITSDAYRVRVVIRNANDNFLSDVFYYTIDRKCGESYIRPQALNPLGGIDSLGLNIREVNGMSVRRSIVRKPNMEVTTDTEWVGDYNARVWAVEPQRTYGVSSKPMSAVMRKWFGENIFTSPDVRIPINDTRWTPIIITTTDLDLYTSEKKPAPIRFEYVHGTDNARQRR